MGDPGGFTFACFFLACLDAQNLNRRMFFGCEFRHRVQSAGHDSFFRVEQGFHAAQDFGAAAEIVEELRVVFRAGLNGGEIAVKNVGACVAKTVDGLVDVAHPRRIRLRPGSDR